MIHLQLRAFKNYSSAATCLYCTRTWFICSYVPLKIIHLQLRAFTVQEHDSSAVTSFYCYNMMTHLKLRTSKNYPPASTCFYYETIFHGVWLHFTLKWFILFYWTAAVVTLNSLWSSCPFRAGCYGVPSVKFFSLVVWRKEVDYVTSLHSIGTINNVYCSIIYE